jgi:hypothetical protein
MFLSSLKQLVFTMEMKVVFCEVGTEFCVHLRFQFLKVLSVKV